MHCFLVSLRLKFLKNFIVSLIASFPRRPCDATSVWPGPVLVSVWIVPQIELNYNTCLNYVLMILRIFKTANRVCKYIFGKTTTKTKPNKNDESLNGTVFHCIDTYFKHTCFRTKNHQTHLSYKTEACQLKKS